MNTTLNTTKVADIGIIGKDGDHYSVNSSGVLTVTNGKYSGITSSGGNDYYSKRGKHMKVTGGSTTKLNTDYDNKYVIYLPSSLYDKEKKYERFI